MAAIAYAVERQTRTTEGHTFVTTGTHTCPHPARCDRQYTKALGITEDYADYVSRHCVDHQLGEFETLVDAERNLGVWCLYYCARHIIGNRSLGTGEEIIARWEPCWEDAEYIANWVFSPTDTEQDVEWEERRFMLRPAAERDLNGAIYKRFKKLTKVRDTQKTSWGKTYITFRQLHAYFVEDRPNFRVLIISGTATLARDHYLEPLKDMWDVHEKLQELYGTTIYTKRHEQLMSRDDPDQDMLEAETRRLCLLAKGSRPKDTLRMRWVVKQRNSSGLSAISLKVAGMETTTTGNRWDLVVVDDPVTPENVLTETQRRKVERKIADLRKQGDADSEFLYLNTPYHIDDASSRIDAEQGDQYHILYRPGMWFENGEPVYYWQYNALEPGTPTLGKLPRNAVWPVERIEAERTQPDFHSQVLLRARNEADLDYSDADFPVVDIRHAPPEVRIGLGGAPVTDEEREWLKNDNVTVRWYLLIDPSGNDQKTSKGDDTWMTACRLDRYGDMWIVRMAAGQMNATEEEQAAFDAWTYVATGGQEGEINYEVASSGKKWVKKGYAEFQAKKSRDMRTPIAMPINFREASSTKSKYTRMDQMHPYIKAGRMKILSNAAPGPLIRKFKDQWIDRGMALHDDGPDSASMIQYYINVTEQFVEHKAQELEQQIEIVDGVLHFPAEIIFRAMADTEAGTTDGHAWGQRG